jgi:hypothetical protein
MTEGWNGMSQNRAAGHQKLLEVAMDGNVGAMAQLGAALYDRGDKIQAVSWLHKGAAMDHTPSKQLMERFGLTHIGMCPPSHRSAASIWLTLTNIAFRFLLLSPSTQRTRRRVSSWRPPRLSWRKTSRHAGLRSLRRNRCPNASFSITSKLFSRSAEPHPFLLVFSEQAAKEKAERLARGEPEQEPVPIEIVYGEDDDDDDDEEQLSLREVEPEAASTKSSEDAKLEEMWLAVDAHQSGTLNRMDVATVLSKMGVRADDDTLDIAMTGEMLFFSCMR